MKNKNLNNIKPDISVIIPVYNTADFLDECIQSLIHQSLQNIELIFVDDGSTDNSVEIIERYQADDSRIKLLKQKNQFAGVARNNGMNFAAGKYIIFLDSDDFFERNMLEEAFLCAEKNQAEIVIFNFWEYDNQTGKERPFPDLCLSANLFSTAILKAEELDKGQSMPWNKLLLLSYVKETGLQYQPLQSCNDEFFNKMIFFLAHRIMYLNKRFVHYRVNNGKSVQGQAHGKKVINSLLNVISVCVAIKSSLIENRIFIDQYKEFYYSFCAEMVQYRFSLVFDRGLSIDLAYNEVKDKLIPQLFDSSENFRGVFWLEAIDNSNCYEDFLITCIKEQRKQISYLNTQYISKQSMDYKLGHTILYFPRKIKKRLSK